jgi:hypothetical protein
MSGVSGKRYLAVSGAGVKARADWRDPAKPRRKKAKLAKGLSKTTKLVGLIEKETQPMTTQQQSGVGKVEAVSVEVKGVKVEGVGHAGSKVVGEVKGALERVAAARNDPALVQAEMEKAVAAVNAWEASQGTVPAGAGSSQS